MAVPVRLALFLLLCLVTAQGKRAFKHKHHRQAAKVSNRSDVDTSPDAILAAINDLLDGELHFNSLDELAQYLSSGSTSDFVCNSGYTIPQSWVCDMMDDCSDGDDEAPEAGCGVQFGCGNGLYVSASSVCDGFPDCSNGQDEAVCDSSTTTTTATTTLSVPQLQECPDGSYLLTSWICDGMEDCPGGEDEEGCVYFECDDGSEIIESWICDNWDDCDGGEDEEGCDSSEETDSDSSEETDSSQSSAECSAPSGVSDSDFSCENGASVPVRYLCDGDNDCGDMSDEPPNVCCDFHCENGETIPVRWLCDGDNDCGDGSDESTDIGCSPGFSCENGETVPLSYLCDGDNDCGDMSDESTDVGCSAGFDCGNGVNVPERYICNGDNDCGNAADESAAANCTIPHCSNYVERVNASQVNKLPVPPGCGVKPKRDILLRLRELLKRDGVDIPERVVGGVESKAGEWPWLVGLTQSNSSDAEPFCGGTLIDAQWVLTASHCVTEGKGACKYYVMVGEHDLISPAETTRQMIQAESVFMHEGYDESSTRNDIALIKLSVPVNLDQSDAVGHACLPPNGNYDMIGKNCSVAGWGTTSSGALTISQVVRHVATPVLTDALCKQLYGENTIEDGMFCAGYVEGGKDSCQGDSGGPLICYDEEENIYTLGGVVSWGYGCAVPQYPGVYTRVSDYGPWIESVIARNT